MKWGNWVSCSQGPSSSKLCDSQMSWAWQCLPLSRDEGWRWVKGRAGTRVLVPSVCSMVWGGRLGLVWSSRQWSCHLWFIRLRKGIPRCPGTTKAHSTYTLIDRLMTITLGFWRALTGCFLLGPLFTCFNNMYQRKGFPEKYTIYQLQPTCPHPIFSNQFVLTSYRRIMGVHHN